jgi:HD-like signal output (HDOD) protein
MAVTLTNIEQSIIELLNKNQLQLPTQPEIAIKIKECSEDPNQSSTMYANIISHDPGLTAKFINIANSPLVRGSVVIDTLQGAISRLGLDFVISNATGLAMAQLFQATNQDIDAILYSVWQNSAKTAAYAYVFAKYLTNISPQKAALAGLMSHVGVLPILVYVQDFLNCELNKQEIEALIKQNHSLIGEFILRSWQFPEEIVQIPSQLSQVKAISKFDLTDVMILALTFATDKTSNFMTIQEDAVNSFNTACPNLENIMSNEVFTEDLTATLKFYCDK